MVEAVWRSTINASQSLPNYCCAETAPARGPPGPGEGHQWGAEGRGPEQVQCPGAITISSKIISSITRTLTSRRKRT